MKTAKRIVITTFGSLGDLHPCMALGLGLAARGHDVTIATGAIYAQRVIAAGLRFAPLRPDIAPNAPEVLTAAMHPRNGTRVVLRDLMMPAVADTYADLLPLVAESDMMISSEVVYAAPLVAEATGIRWISLFLAPISFLSAYQLPVVPAAPWLAALRGLPPALVRPVLFAGRMSVRSWWRPIADLRKRLGLRPARDPIFFDKLSPLLNLALFAPALGTPLPDWPARTAQTGFVFYDAPGPDDRAVPPEVERFLSAGPPPLVFTLGSAAVMIAGDFFMQSVLAARQIGQRALLVAEPSARADMVEVLGPQTRDVCVADYLPYSQVFPRAAAIVHQGGVGTTAQALRAGKPMLVVPFSHDQPDNAARVTRLGIAATIHRRRYTAARAASALDGLLRRPGLAERAAEIGQEIRRVDGIVAACDAIERCA